MTNKHALLGACALAIALAVSPTAANAQGYYDYAEEPVNLALGAEVGELIPPEYRSDTLAAVNDGILYPEVPHGSGGPNPYAWTNYNSVQSKFTPGGGFYLDFSREVKPETVVLYQFVDSYSASLPQKVAFSTELYGSIYSYESELISSEQVSPTCWKMVYRLSDEASGYGQTIYDGFISRLSVYELEQWGPGDKVVDRCVGVYEIEVYGQGAWQTDCDFDLNAVQEGWYSILCAADNGFSLDVNGASAGDRANIQIYRANDSAAQRFYITPTGDGYYNILTGASGLASAIDVTGNGKVNGTNIIQFHRNYAEAQAWTIERNEDGSVSFYAKGSGLALDFAGASCQNFTNVALWTPNGSAAQRFTLVSIV